MSLGPLTPQDLRQSPPCKELQSGSMNHRGRIEEQREEMSSLMSWGLRPSPTKSFQVAHELYFRAAC